MNLLEGIVGYSFAAPKTYSFEKPCWSVRQAFQHGSLKLELACKQDVTKFEQNDDIYVDIGLKST